MFEEQVMTGAWLSATTTCCVHTAELPDPSSTDHTTVFVPIPNAAGALFVTLDTLQLSVVTGTPRLTFEAVQRFESTFTTRLDGQVITGDWLSTAITVCVQALALPEVSVTVHTTEFVPNGNGLGALFVTLATPQLSDVLGVPRLTPEAVQRFASTLTTRLEE